MPFFKPIIFNIHLRRLCTAVTINKKEHIKYSSKTKGTVKGRGMTKEMKQFFESDSELLDVLPHIPPKYLRINTPSQHHYLISPTIAKKIVDKIMPFVDVSGKQLIAETNAGLGLITAELLERGLNLVRMYESCSEFRIELKDFGKVYPNRVELFTKDIYLLHRYAYFDKYTRQKRVENLFSNVTKRSWTDEPFMTVIGPMNGFTFLNYLVRAVALQIVPAMFGRIQIFALMKAKEYAMLAATHKDSLKLYKKVTILHNSVFDIELLGTYPKKFFLPWMGRQELKYPSVYKDYNMNLRYLVRITFKKNLPLEAEKLLHFMYFLKQFYITGNPRVIPTVEKWLPGSGINIICPNFKHDNFPIDMNIFTQFRNLTPPQILAVYREIANHPMYSESSFMGMVQHELMESETIETDMAVDYDPILLEDIQEKLDESDE